MLILGHDAELIEWARCHGFMECGPATTIGFAREGKIVGVALFFNYRHPDIEWGVISTSRKWATKAHFRAIANYVFGQLQCRRLTAEVDASDSKLCALMERIGFQREGTKRQATEHGDSAIYGLLKSECRWYEEP